MIDVDGVVVRRPEGRPWYVNLQADLGIDPAMLNTLFFGEHFDDVVCGRADLFERLDLVMPMLGHVSSRELVDYWFTQDATLDDQLLSDLEQAKAQGFDLHLATVQEHHRARYLWDTLSLREHFTRMHYAADVGYGKTDAAFYRVIESRTGLRPAEHCLVDDSEPNVVAARRVGWRAFHWTPEARVADVLEECG